MNIFGIASGVIKLFNNVAGFLREKNLMEAGAAKQQIKLFPLETIRIEGAYYKMIVHEPITVSKTASDDEMLAIALQINELLESWIKERPEQWLWPHRRWGRIKA